MYLNYVNYGEISSFLLTVSTTLTNKNTFVLWCSVEYSEWGRENVSDQRRSKKVDHYVRPIYILFATRKSPSDREESPWYASGKKWNDHNVALFSMLRVLLACCVFFVTWLIVIVVLWKDVNNYNLYKVHYFYLNFYCNEKKL